MSMLKILIVEDKAIVADNTRTILRKEGYSVVGISVTAEDAITKAEELHPDVILMDIMLFGEKTGIDAGREIKEKMDISIIYTTAYSDIKSIKEAELTGPVAYMVKPIDFEKLVICIELINLQKLAEKQMEQKINELLEEKDATERAKLKKEVYTMRMQITKQQDMLMLFINT